MDSKFIKVPFRFTLGTDHGPYQQLGVLFDVQHFPEPTNPTIKIRSVGFCGMDVQRFLSEAQINHILASCSLSLDNGIKSVDTDGAKRYDVVTPEFHSNFD